MPIAPFIQSVYPASVVIPARGSACAAKLASGVQYTLHVSHPLPASHATKNASATCVIDPFSITRKPNTPSFRVASHLAIFPKPVKQTSRQDKRKPASFLHFRAFSTLHRITFHKRTINSGGHVPENSQPPAENSAWAVQNPTLNHSVNTCYP